MVGIAIALGRNLFFFRQTFVNTLTSGFVKNNKHESDQYTLHDVLLIRNHLYSIWH